MMQKYLFILLCNILLLPTVNAQFVDVTGEYAAILSIEFRGTDIIFSDLDTPNSAVYSGDLSSLPVNATSVVNETSISSMTVDGDFLYYTTSTELYRYNLVTGGAATLITSNLAVPTDLYVYGNNIYIANYGFGDIIKADLSGSFPVTSTELLVNQTAYNFAGTGNLLYYNDIFNSNVKRINLDDVIPTPEQVTADGTVANPIGIEIDGTDLYLSDRNNNQILLFDLTGSFPVSSSTVAYTVTAPEVLRKNGSDLYITTGTVGGDTKIMRNANVLNTPTFSKGAVDFTLTPNPTGRNVQLTSNVSITEVEVFSLLGQKLSTYTTSSIQNTKSIEINMEQLQAGTYLIKVQSEAGTLVKKVIKK